MNECSKCIHNAVCKTAESCDGYVSGCEHFKEQKKGRWIPAGITEDLAKCSVCGKMNHSLDYVYKIGFNYCPNCGADMKGE